ncbi:MAG: M20 family metallopeptidase [Candidatus Heimdallarchaeaceae archaeon]
MERISEQEVIPILQQLIQFQTINPPGETLEAIKYVAKIFEDKDIPYKIHEYKEGHANLIAEYGSGEKSIILCGHIDVVPAGDEDKWSYPAFAGEEHEDKIYGRGSTDMKGALAAFISVLNKLKEQEVQLNTKVKLLITSDEEIGMEGAKFSLKNDVMEDADFIIIGEPTELQLAKAQKGVFWAKIKIKGKSAHGSTPELGVNAIEAATELIPLIKTTVPESDHSLLNQSTINIGKINGGTSFNVVPEYCEFTLDYRIIPRISYEDLKNRIRAVLDDFNKTHAAQAEMEVVHVIPPIEMTKESAFFDILMKKVQENGVDEIIGVTYGTDGAVLVPPHDTPFVIFGPGRLDQLHVTDEYTLKEEVVTYANLILEAISEAFNLK